MLLFTGGNWCFYLNGKRQLSGLGLGPRRNIPSGGEFVLGQSSRPNVEFPLDNAFLGDLAHFNIWSYAKTFEAIEKIWTDCTFMYCGNAVQWVEFRTGTRGAMRLRWPSGIAREWSPPEQVANLLPVLRRFTIGISTSIVNTLHGHISYIQLS